MRIGLRGGHSPNCKGAMGILDEQVEVRKIYNELKPLLEAAGHEVIDCNSNASNVSAELAEGTNKANASNCDAYMTIHMNASNGIGHGTECLLYDAGNIAMSGFASLICQNFRNAGFTDRGTKYNKGLHDLNASNMPGMIIETLFCDNVGDADLYKKLGAEAVARLIGNAIDCKIPLIRSINATIQQNTGADHMRLSILHEGDYVRIKDKEHGYYLTASGNSAGANVDFRPESGQSDQLWRMIKKQYKDADYTMCESVAAPGLFLSVDDNGQGGKNNLKLWTDLHNMKQKFYVREEADGLSLIIHAFTGMCVAAKAK